MQSVCARQVARAAPGRIFSFGLINGFREEEEGK